MNWKRLKILSLAVGIAILPVLASAQLAVTVSPTKITGQKALVKLSLKNTFSEEIESARAALFVTDTDGKMVGQATQWVIGGTKGKRGLEPDKEAQFNFVVTLNKANWAATNLNVRVMFNKLVLAGAKEANPVRDVKITMGK